MRKPAAVHQGNSVPGPYGSAVRYELAYSDCLYAVQSAASLQVHKSSSMLNNIILDEKKPTQVVDIYPDDFISDLQIRSENSKYSVYDVTDDFFGVLKGLDLNEKKINVLDTYKLIFRFSICKLIDYLSRPELLIMTVQYLQDTQMDRVHRRKVLAKNQKAYYRALENLLNLCSLN